MKEKYATFIICEVFKSMVDEDRLTETEANMIERIISDMFYGKKIRINHYMDTYPEYFEKLED